jgi:acetamidase/formamidase
MTTLTADYRFYAFSAGNPPALKVDSGTEVLIEAQDCYSNQIRSEEVQLSAVDWTKTNPLRGLSTSMVQSREILWWSMCWRSDLPRLG